MNQVIQNIIINAKQAMPEGGKVLISTENVTGENGMKHLRISIKDTGIGIPENHLAKIFDPYFTTKQTGSGLGLSVCYSVVQKHGGRIFVESKIGIGTTFHIMLPATDRVTTEPTGASISEMPARKGKILIMDDDEMLRDVLTSMLQLNGHSIISSWDGNEAISLYVDAMQIGEPFDVVIMDLTIPGGMGGKEAIQEILAINPKAKVIVSSGYSDDPIMSDPLEYGFIAAISKPYQIKDLIKIVSSVSES
jgi:two-component system cell cycle sensor histidine kinase/response regulator CckA